MTAASRSRRACTQARTRVRGKKKSALSSSFGPLYAAAMMGAGLKMLDKFERTMEKDSGRVSLTLEWGADRDG